MTWYHSGACMPSCRCARATDGVTIAPEVAPVSDTARIAQALERIAALLEKITAEPVKYSQRKESWK